MLLGVLLATNSSSFAKSKAASDVKTQVATLGVGKKAQVTLSDGSNVKGVIAAISDSGFTLDHGKAQGSHEYSYTDVSHVRREGMSRKVKTVVIIIVVSVALGIVSHFTV
jgi:hypothetical protein